MTLASYYRRNKDAAPPPRWRHPALESADTTLRAAATRARELGEAHGWSPSTVRCAMDGLMVLLDGRLAGERVTFTEIRLRMPRHASTPRIAEVLADLGLLDDDRSPAIRSWIERRTGELPEALLVRYGPGCCCATATPGPGPLARQHLRLLRGRPAVHRALVSRPRPSP